MKIIGCGISGSAAPPQLPGWEELGLNQKWLEVINELAPGTHPRSTQVKAIKEGGLFLSRKNMIVSAPTNSGKSLVGHLFCLQAIASGKRAVLLEPMRAIAQEKYEELQGLAPMLSEILGCTISIKISTGDYRLENERMSDDAPLGEFLIATPERFESIIRNPDNQSWLEGFGAVCLDEAHLISQPPRGGVMEGVLTNMLCLNSPPRICLLSATLGDSSKALEWLSPCGLVDVKDRFPTLKKNLVELGEEEDLNESVGKLLSEILEDPGHQAVVFVYQTASAEKLAKGLSTLLGKKVGEEGAMAFHSKMSTAQKAKVRKCYMDGSSRCVVATTSLAMGVNLPATHVILRDVVFPGAGELSNAEILQMLGRAGRGDKQGVGYVLLKAGSKVDSLGLQAGLQEETLPDFQSSHESSGRSSWKGQESSLLLSFGRLIASELSRRQINGSALEDLEDFFSKSLGGNKIKGNLPATLCELQQGGLSLQADDGKFYLTSIGKVGVQATLPLNMISGIGQLFQDLIDADAGDELFKKWTMLDSLVLLSLFEGEEGISRSLASDRQAEPKLVEKVDSWFERSSIKSAIHSQWLRKGADECEMFLTSLGLNSTSRKDAYQALRRSILLLEMGQGKFVKDLERTWKVKDLVGIQEKLRDQMIWLLGGLAKILEVRCFFRHMKERNLSDERIQSVEKLFKKMRARTYNQIETLKYCSPLGPLVRGLRQQQSRQSGKRIGVQTIRKLGDAGITTLQGILDLGLESLVNKGIRRDYGKQLVGYARRRLNG